MRLAPFVLLLVVMGTMGCMGGTLPPPDGPPAHVTALLWREPFPRILVEVDHAPHITPDASALQTLVQTLRNVTGKDVALLEPAPLPAEARFSGDRAWSIHEVMTAHKESSSVAKPPALGVDDTAVLHVLYLNGHAGDDIDADHAILGWQHLNLLVIFMDEMALHPSVGPFRDGVPHPKAAEAERAVVVHEAGHALGLVNHGAPMVRPRASEDGIHSRNPESVMYPTVDTSVSIERVLSGDPIPFTFDADDLADLRNVRSLEPAR
jgi:hypothetical protein